VDFALRDAGFDLDEASDIAALAAGQEKALAGAHTAKEEADEAATVCDKLRPGAPCPTPGSCRENGCSAVERELLDEAATVGADVMWRCHIAEHPEVVEWSPHAPTAPGWVGRPYYTHPQDASAKDAEIAMLRETLRKIDDRLTYGMDRAGSSLERKRTMCDAVALARAALPSPPKGDAS
jgi:hypothetical protein